MAGKLCRITTIFMVIIVMGVLLVPVIRQHPYEKEHMADYVAMPSQAGMLNYGQMFRNNTDLDYASVRWKIQMTEDEKRKTQPLAPIVRQYEPVIARML